MSSMPAQTVHVQALAMGHNMLTLNPAWSMAVIGKFFGESDQKLRSSGIAQKRAAP
jgi:hypothetical protein